MTDYLLLRAVTYCEDCDGLATQMIDSWWNDHGELVWEHFYTCDAHAPSRELAAYTQNTEAVASMPVRYVIDGVLWPPTVGLLSHLTGEGNAA